MQINELVQKVDLSKRAVKYYEEQGLLKVEKGANGYRNYSEQNVEILKKISAYRKLGISIKDIKTLLEGKNSEFLENIFGEKSRELEKQSEELKALRRFIEEDEIDGFYGHYFMHHFMPYLQIQIKTPEQEQAYNNIIQFWDNTEIKVPLMMRIVGEITYRFSPEMSVQQLVMRADNEIKRYIQMSEEDYEAFKCSIEKNVKLQTNLFFKYCPMSIIKRKFQKQLQDKGYNDIFIPNMIALSPKYKEYHEALLKANDRVCADLGLYYDSGFNLVMKK